MTAKKKPDAPAAKPAAAPAPQGAAGKPQPSPAFMPPDELSFDIRNPRLVAYDLKPDTPEPEIVKILWDEMDVQELMMSIAASGFFRKEPLIVAEEDGKHVVIEGNRRLAAVRILRNPAAYAEKGITNVPQISPVVRETLEALPVQVESRETAWRFLGFKHVNGPAKWNSYAKARYVAQVHNEFTVPLSDIASQIGDTHRTVRRLYRGLMVVEQAERAGVFNREDRFNKHFSFSHLYTGLQYDNISRFISIKSEEEESRDPVPVENLDQLRQLCLWLFGTRKDETAPIVESQNPDLRNLNAVLGNREAIAALKRKVSLLEAVELARPGTDVFEEALYNAKASLKKARAMLTAGYDGSETLLRVAGTVAQMADDLYNEMVRKAQPEKKERLTEE